MKLLDTDDDRARKAKEEIVGVTALEYAPFEYWDLGVMQSLNVPYLDWMTLDPHDRAKLKARFYLSNMMETIDRYYKYVDDKIKSLSKKKE